MTTNAANELQSIQTVSLEFLRPGPAHGQLLSPLTPYIALCGDKGPVTLQIEIEHWKLLNSLHRLRYIVKGMGRNKIEVVPDRIRQSEVLELGEEVGRIVGNIPTLASELGRAAGRLESRVEDGGGFVHLRLITSGSELSLIPFELMISPEGYPGDGIAMTLQSHMPIVITREVRRGRPASLDWNRPPRVLFVSASPEGLYVPQRAHLHAIRVALDPWILWGAEIEGKKPIENVKDHVTVLLNASIEDIERECGESHYSHVHILAHGDSYDEAGQLRYGLALHSDTDREQKKVVSGKRLAEALSIRCADDGRKSRPLVVTLATCDSGNVRSVAVPGGSIAHDLHANGIPWVLASQFPLTMTGSVRMATLVYKGLFLGEDPRRLLCRLRASLHVGEDNDHDWASVVAYASVSDDLTEEVHDFRGRQMRHAIETELDRADKSSLAENTKLLEESIAAAREWVERWIAGLPPGNGEFERNQHAECYGVAGATEKRAAAMYREGSGALADRSDAEDEVRKLLKRSREYYMKAMNKGLAHLQHWPASQYLSLTAVLNEKPDRDRWLGTVAWASQDLQKTDPSEVAWAHGTLAELEMLRVHHDPDIMRGSKQTKAKRYNDRKEKVVEHCRSIVDLAGKDSFHVMSTRRQFTRYVDWWRDERWDDIAKAAVEAAVVSLRIRVSGYDSFLLNVSQGWVLLPTFLQGHAVFSLKYRR